MALSTTEREQFLAEPHVAALSVAAGPDRAPLTVPIWYAYSPGGDVLVVTGADSRKARLIESAGRFSLMVDRVSPSVRYVSVEGPVVATAAADPETTSALAHRYLPPEAAEAYLAMAQQQIGAEVAITMRPEHWLSADLGSF